MNILIVTQLYPQPDDIGGNRVTSTVEYFAKEWVADKHNVYIMHCSSKFPFIVYMIPNKIKKIYSYLTSNIIPSFKSRKFIYREKDGIKIYRLPIFKMFPGRNFTAKKLRHQSSYIINELKKVNFIPDIVMGHFANPSLEIVANLSNHYKCMSSIVFHRDCTDKNIVKYRIQENITGIKAVGARSILEAVEVKSKLGLKEIPFVCYSGIPNEYFLNADSNINKPPFEKGVNYIFVGSIIKRKHLDKVILAFSEVSNNQDKLEIIGSGPDDVRMKKLSIKIKSNNIDFIGRLSRAKVLDKMRQSHIFALISDDETYGMVYIEAMLQGCLVIASLKGGFDGIIVDGYNGFLCKSGDAKMLKDIFVNINSMTEQQRRIIQFNAIKTALDFSEKSVSSKYLHEVITRNEEI